MLYEVITNSTTATIVGLLVLLFSGALDWSDVTGERTAWDTLVWFACLLTMANFLNTLGFIPRITSYNVCYTKLLRSSFATASL